MDIGISILGSGSSGNSIVIHNQDYGIMIDAGFSRSGLISRMEECGIKPDIIRALVLSHEHDDHCRGARVFADSFGIPTYCSVKTRKILQMKNMISENVILFESGVKFKISDFNIETFNVPHDAEDTVGFVVSINGLKIGIATDLGHVNGLCQQRLKGCDAIILESNHDVKMQLNSKRHPNLKRRVLGRHGHLSNEAAAEALEGIITENTKSIFLVHLSSECNEYKIVEKTIKCKLAMLRREDILLHIATKSPYKTVYLKKEEKILS